MIPHEEITRIQTEAIAGKMVRSADILRLITEIIVLKADAERWRKVAGQTFASCNQSLAVLRDRVFEARELVKDLVMEYGGSRGDDHRHRGAEAIARWEVGL